jgi:hypothetical protein
VCDARDERHFSIWDVADSDAPSLAIKALLTRLGRLRRSQEMSRNFAQHQAELGALVSELADAATLRDLRASPEAYGIVLGFFYGDTWEMDGEIIINIPSDCERQTAIAAARRWVSQGHSLIDLVMPGSPETEVPEDGRSA